MQFPLFENNCWSKQNKFTSFSRLSYTFTFLLEYVNTLWYKNVSWMCWYKQHIYKQRQIEMSKIYIKS